LLKSGLESYVLAKRPSCMSRFQDHVM